MIIERHKKADLAKEEFNTLEDLSTITTAVKRSAQKMLPTSKSSAKILQTTYNNLRATKVHFLLHDGAFEPDHWVAITDDRHYLIDLTGDRFSFTRYNHFQHQVTPWIYQLNLDDRRYYSWNHMPISRPDDIDDSFTDMEVVKALSNPFVKGLRCIIL